MKLERVGAVAEIAEAQAKNKAEDKADTKMPENKMNISASPHIRSGETTTGIMADVMIALLPAAAMGVYNFGLRAALMILICVTACMVFEYFSEILMKRKNTVRDLSAAVTGMLLAMNLPVDLPYWMAILGCLFAIVVVKQLFGGIGQNFMNPALAARCFLVLSFVGPMTTFTYDAVTTATPLSVLRSDGVSAVSVWSMFLGNEAGTIGETSALALLIGAAYLLIRRVIRLTIPAFYLGSFSLFITIYGLTQDMSGFALVRYVAAHVVGGGLMLGAFFMATDYTTSPITGKGRMIYGVLLGALTFCFRAFGSSAEGVSYAIIIGNLLVPMIEMITKPKSFGEGYEKKPLSENRGWLTPVVLDEEGKPVEQKEKNGTLRIILTICMIALVAGGLLGAVYAVTKDPIAKTAEKKKQESFKTVMPDADSYREYTADDAWRDLVYPSGDEAIKAMNEKLSEEGYTGVTLVSRTDALSKDGETVGRIWIISTREGYAGDIKMAVGIKDGKVTGISMLEIGETTGLGMEARDNPDFTAQYVGKDVEKYVVVKTAPGSDDEIQAITGATITSKAVTGAVNAVLLVDRLVSEGTGTEGWLLSPDRVSGRSVDSEQTADAEENAVVEVSRGIAGAGAVDDRDSTLLGAGADSSTDIENDTAVIGDDVFGDDSGAFFDEAGNKVKMTGSGKTKKTTGVCIRDGWPVTATMFLVEPEGDDPTDYVSDVERAEIVYSTLSAGEQNSETNKSETEEK